jgi:hypothetical protein
MKQISIAFSFFVLIFSGCKKSSNDTTIQDSGFQWPAGTSDYAPYTNGSTFTYEIVSGTPSVTDSFTYSVTKDTTISGATYRKLESNKPTLGPTYYANYNNGVVTNVAYNVNFQGQITIPTITQTILKDNVPVNNTWSEVLNVTASGFTVPVTFTYTIMLKDYTKTILSKDYANTIYAKQIIGIPANIALLLNIPATTQVDNYFAKGVGLVQKDATGNNVKIKRYNIVK